MTKEEGDKLFVLVDRQGFCIKISNISCAGNEVDSEQFLRNMINDPIKTHVYGF